MVTSLDSNLLLSIYASRTSGGAGGSALGLPAKKVAPTAPWSQATAPAQTSAAVKAALAGRGFINENAAQLDLSTASQDYRKLFALYQGLTTLSELANQAQKKDSPRLSARGLRPRSPRA